MRRLIAIGVFTLAVPCLAFGQAQPPTAAAPPAQAQAETLWIDAFRVTKDYRESGRCGLKLEKGASELMADCVVHLFRDPTTLEQVTRWPVGFLPVDTGATGTQVSVISYASVLTVERGSRSGSSYGFRREIPIPKEHRGRPWVKVVYTNWKGKKAEAAFICRDTSDADRLALLLAESTGKMVRIKDKL